MNHIEEIQPIFTVNILVQTRKVILKMPLSLQEKIYLDLDDLSVYGNELQEPKVRDLGDSLKELRTSAKDGIARSFSFFISANRFMLFTPYKRKHQNRI